MMIYLHLFYTFFKIGIFTIGGGYAMIPMIKEEVVSNGWLSVNDLIDFIAISESTPGPFAINIATFIGTETAGIIGAITATIGVVLPSFIIILIIAKFFDNFKDNQYVKAALSGLRPMVIALIASATFSIAMTNLVRENGVNWRGLVCIVIIFGISRWKKKMHPIFLICISAVLGMLLFGVWELLL